MTVYVFMRNLIYLHFRCRVIYYCNDIFILDELFKDSLNFLDLNMFQKNLIKLNCSIKLNILSQISKLITKYLSNNLPLISNQTMQKALSKHLID